MKRILSVLTCVNLLMGSVAGSEKGDISKLQVNAIRFAIDTPDLFSADNEQPANVITFDQALKAWAGGKQDKAVELFLKVQWDQPDIFDPNSVFRVSEEEFVKLPKARRDQIQQKALNVSKDVKMLTKFIIQQAREKGGYTSTRDALIACGNRLSRDDQLLLIQMVGKAIVGYTEKELPVF